VSNLSKKRELLKKEFRRDMTSLNSSLAALNYSYEKCIKIGIKDEYSDDELEIFEALTSRFARTSDIFTQKILTTIFVLLKENPHGFIDKANLSEKLGIIPKSKDLQEIRELRNEISHEYSMRDISEIFEDVLNFSATLKDILKSAQPYIDKKFPEDEKENSQEEDAG
jgi:hypothetical protein